MQNYGAPTYARPQRRGAQIAFIMSVVFVGLIAAVCLVSYARNSSMMTPITTFQMLNAGNEFLVADALMKHATDKQFDINPPVPDNIAALAKEAEDEMKIDAKVMQTGKADRR
mmetsp:Transcript_82845/g.222205  ORF Transcript_82845/g.222205 Transcript_82845/m.222205 type:complete len:113 (-) Transcript_82845:163-501(-)